MDHDMDIDSFIPPAAEMRTEPLDLPDSHNDSGSHDVSRVNQSSEPNVSAAVPDETHSSYIAGVEGIIERLQTKSHLITSRASLSSQNLLGDQDEEDVDDDLTGNALHEVAPGSDCLASAKDDQDTDPSSALDRLSGDTHANLKEYGGMQYGGRPECSATSTTSLKPNVPQTSDMNQKKKLDYLHITGSGKGITPLMTHAEAARLRKQSAEREERNQKVLQCSDCGYQAKGFSQLYRHLHVIHSTIPDGITTYPCDHCPDIFFSTVMLKRHVMCHETKELLPCEECGRMLTRHSLKNHRHSHNIDPEKKHTVCEICGESFKSRKGAAVHRQKHDGTYTPEVHVCVIDGCNKKLSCRSTLQRHITVCHRATKNITCPYNGCDRKFANKSNFTVHLRQHTGIEPFNCKLCPYTSKHNGCLKSHMKSKHPGFNLEGEVMRPGYDLQGKLIHSDQDRDGQENTITLKTRDTQ